MNHAIAVDASVAVKWVVLEPLTAQARALVTDSLAARRALIAPPHFAGEVTNALHQRWRSADPNKRLTYRLNNSRPDGAGRVAAACAFGLV